MPIPSCRSPCACKLCCCMSRAWYVYKSGAESRPQVDDGLCVGEAANAGGCGKFVEVVKKNLEFFAFCSVLACLIWQQSANNKDAHSLLWTRLCAWAISLPMRVKRPILMGPGGSSIWFTFFWRMRRQKRSFYVLDFWLYMEEDEYKTAFFEAQLQ